MADTPLGIKNDAILVGIDYIKHICMQYVLELQRYSV